MSLDQSASANTIPVADKADAWLLDASALAHGPHGATASRIRARAAAAAPTSSASSDRTDQILQPAGEAILAEAPSARREERAPAGDAQERPFAGHQA